MGDGRPVRQALLGAGYIAFLLTFCMGVSADTPPYFSIVLPADSVARYEKLEILCPGIDSSGYINPFNPDEVSVEGHFTDPDGVEEVAYGFWYQDYARYLVGNYEVLTASGAPHWRVRYAPKKVGSYSCHVTVTDSGGTVQSQTRNFTVTASGKPGFLRVPPGDSHYFRFDNGDSFFGIGSGACWWNFTRKTYWYDDHFTNMGNYGANFARVWIDNTISVHTTWLVTIQDSQLGGNYDLADAWRLDHILQAAEENGIYIQLNLHDVNQFAYNWYNEPADEERNLYALECGGPCADRWHFFTNATAKNYAKRVLRYMVARYAHNTSLASWELWNEINELQWSTDLFNSTELLAWHQEFAQWFKQTDPYDHTVTTSLGSFYHDEALWELDEMEYAQVHGYYVPNWPHHPSDPLGRDMADFVNYYTNFVTQETNNKPVVFGEFGLVNSTFLTSEYLDGTAPDDFEGIHIHNGFWSGLMSGLAATPLSFEWHYFLEHGYPSWFEQCTGIANFVAGEDLTADAFVPVGVGTISVSNDNVRVLGLKNDTSGLFWIQNKDHTWYKIVAQSAEPSVISSATFSIPQLTTGSYTIEWWDTYSGTVVSEERAMADQSGTLTLAVPPLETDIACKIERDPDADLDGLPDVWEMEYGLDPNDPTGENGADGDPDGDGLTNLEEFANGTHPRVGDTDGDGLTDGAEVHTYATDPTDADTDNDRLDDGAEINTHGTDPRDPDTDGDDLKDGDEVRDLDPYTPGLQNPFDPLDPDSTGDDFSNVPDGVPDGQNDYDGDGQTNEYELRWGPYVGNPLDPAVTVPALAMAALCMLVTVIIVAGSRKVRHENA